MSITRVSPHYYHPEVKYVYSGTFMDKRGTFQESFNKKDFKKHGLPTTFVQDNVSVSFHNVFRGLHIQLDNPQGKLVQCLRGSIRDFFVDVRPDSPNYGILGYIDLDDQHGTAAYIPPGFAHGFLVRNCEKAVVSYKCTTLYDPKSDCGINFNQFEEITRLMNDLTVVSDKDKNLLTLEAFRGKTLNYRSRKPRSRSRTRA